jgi:hypothetical protein
MDDRPLRSGQVTGMPIGGHGIGHGHASTDISTVATQTCSATVLPNTTLLSLGHSVKICIVSSPMCQ